MQMVVTIILCNSGIIYTQRYTYTVHLLPHYLLFIATSYTIHIAPSLSLNAHINTPSMSIHDRLKVECYLIEKLLSNYTSVCSSCFKNTTKLYQYVNIYRCYNLASGQKLGANMNGCSGHCGMIHTHMYACIYIYTIRYIYIYTMILFTIYYYIMCYSLCPSFLSKYPCWYTIHNNLGLPLT